MFDTGAVSRRGQRAAKPTKGDRQERALLTVAAQIIAEGRTSTVSVSDIADAAAISRAAFYFYFASKQELFASVVDETVSVFNARILEAVARDYDDPAEGVRATITSAGQLWWDHSAIMVSSVMLGTTMPDVYRRNMENISNVRTPTIELLKRYGTVPEAHDDKAATELVTSLILLCERSFYDLMRGTPTPAELDQLVSRLSTIWLRAFGIAEPS